VLLGGLNRFSDVFERPNVGLAWESRELQMLARAPNTRLKTFYRLLQSRVSFHRPVKRKQRFELDFASCLPATTSSRVALDSSLY
jgi:hypothetical protein